MDKYIMMGPQGSGKGTQSSLLCRDFDFVHISIGDIFRWNVRNHTKLAARIKKITDAGLLVPDEIVEGVVRGRLEEHDWNYGFVVDGFPRTRPQAEYLFETWNLDRVIYIDIHDDVVYERVMSRALVGEGSGFTKRADDNPEVLRTRLREYYEKTKPLLELYARKGMLVTIDGNRPIEEVYYDVQDKLGLLERKQTPEPQIVW
ncbi:MAG: nucleoside monophosphate kinase [Bryobacterales bacterium]|nr:nucleoside monophosphate kinase [Bryobacterales bacterium]